MLDINFKPPPPNTKPKTQKNQFTPIIGEFFIRHTQYNARFHIHTQFIQHRKIFISMIGNFRFLYLYRLNFVQWRKLTYYRHDLQQCIFYHVTGIFTDC